MSGRSQGFTLVEVLVVLAVISIVAVMGVQSVLAGLEMSRERHTETEILAMVDLVRLYKSETDACVPGTDEADFRDWLLANNYFDRVELSDGWGKAYHILIHCNPDDGTEYLLWSSDGRDGQRGSDDDVAYLFTPDGFDGWTGTGAYN
jgi:prepilin-type N-terminal cleavage/methylation domain-containing protein